MNSGLKSFECGLKIDFDTSNDKFFVLFFSVKISDYAAVSLSRVYHAIFAL